MNLTRTEARERADLIAVDSYDVSLDLTRGESVFGATTTVRFSAAPGSFATPTPGAPSRR